MKSINIKTAKYIQDYKIQLEFDNKETKILDFANLLETSPYPNEKRYLDIELFRQFKVEMGDLIFNDYDMCFQAKNLYEGILRK